MEEGKKEPFSIPKGALKQAFCKHYSVMRNGTKAAIEAGYSAKTASQIAYRLLQDEEIKSYIEYLEQEKLAEANISKEDLLLELKAIAFSDMADFVTVEGGNITFKDFDEMPEGATRLIAEVGQTITKDGGSYKFKLHDKLNAVGKLLDMLGYKAPIKKEIKNETTNLDKTVYSIKNRAKKESE